MSSFSYEFSCKEHSSQLTVNIPIPLKTSTNEFCERLAIAHDLPCFVIPGRRKNVHIIDSICQGMSTWCILRMQNIPVGNVDDSCDDFITKPWKLNIRCFIV